MAIKVIKKYSTIDLAENHVVSTDNIIAPRMAMWGMRGINSGEYVFELTAPIKPAINIKLDAYGKPSVTQINLGIQHEHYST